MFKQLYFFSVLLSCFTPIWAEESKNTVIINNEAKAKQQVISAPALVPSDAVKLRNLREKQEVQTEDTILRELEKQRILDEQKRLDNMIGNNKQPSIAPPSSAPVSSEAVANNWFFGNKSFVSLGAGFIHYYKVKNVNSTEIPTFLGSFGAYGYEGNLIFELSAYYSTHYLKTPNKKYPEILRERLSEPGLSIAVKYSPLKGKTKPYLGLTGSVVGRKWDLVKKDGSDISSDDPEELKAEKKDVAEKNWNLSFYGGVALGADLALGERFGVNVDMRYYVNIDTENRKTLSQILTEEEILDERDSMLFSASLRYYFN